jgi:hypothetical protein
MRMVLPVTFWLPLRASVETVKTDIFLAVLFSPF